MAFRGGWYHIEGRGHHILPFLTAFWYPVVIILFVIIIAVLIFRLDVSLAKEDVALRNASKYGRICVWAVRTWLIIALVTL